LNAFWQGLALGLGLIVAIGAQNAFVLRQGLRREHVGSVVLLCAVADVVLIALGVWGMALLTVTIFAASTLLGKKLGSIFRV
jgi:L-lysine exporter family protein LysE/ArgO